VRRIDHIEVFVMERNQDPRVISRGRFEEKYVESRGFYPLLWDNQEGTLLIGVHIILCQRYEGGSGFSLHGGDNFTFIDMWGRVVLEGK